jgi:hypothetical protein
MRPFRPVKLGKVWRIGAEEPASRYPLTLRDEVHK